MSAHMITVEEYIETRRRRSTAGDLVEDILHTLPVPLLQTKADEHDFEEAFGVMLDFVVTFAAILLEGE